MTLKAAVALLLLGVPAAASGQSRAEADTMSACCRVVRLEGTSGHVTARETSTGYTFRFTVKDRRVRAAIKIGDAVWADFATKIVKLRMAEGAPCCLMVEMPSPPQSSLSPKPPER